MKLANITRVVILFLCYLQSDSKISYDDTVEESIRQVHVVMRHGSRAPLESFAGDKNNNESNWKYGFGQLLPEGLKMHDDLGRWFRKRYDGFLDAYPNHKQIEVRSTDVDRVLNSAQANLAGLFYLSDVTERYNEDLPYTPVAVHTNDAKSDKLIRVGGACPGVEKILLQTMKTNNYISKMTEDNTDLMKELALKLQTKVENLVDVQFIYDDYKIIKSKNFTIPSWLEKLMPRMKMISNEVFEILTFTDDLKRLKVGPLLNKISSEMKHTIDSVGESKRFLMYSGHDVTVASHLNTLGNFNGLQPPYASAVIYELHQDNATGHHFVRILYHNDTSFSSQLHPLLLPNCFFSCPFDSWTDYISYYLPDQTWDYECQYGYPSYKTFGDYFLMYWYSFINCIRTFFCYLFYGSNRC